MTALPGISARPRQAVISRYEARLLATRACAAVAQAPSWDRETGAYATEASPFMLRRIKLHIARTVPTERRPGRLPTALRTAPGALFGRRKRSLLGRVAAANHVLLARFEPVVTWRSRPLGSALALDRGFVQQGVSAIRHSAAAGNA